MTGAAPGASSRSATAGLCACRSRMGEEQHVLRAAAAGPAAAGAGLPPAVHARVLQLACEVMAESSKAVVVLSADQGRDFLCELLRHLGRDAVPGFNGVDFYGMLFWEQELAAGNDPFLNGACTGPLSGGCAPTDFVNALMGAAQSTSNATAEDVVIAVKDRLFGVPSITEVERPFIEALLGVPLSAPVDSVEINTFETGVRRFAGLLLNTPQYMLSGVAPTDPFICLPDSGCAAVRVTGFVSVLVAMLLLPSDNGLFTSCVLVHGMGGNGSAAGPPTAAHHAGGHLDPRATAQDAPASQDAEETPHGVALLDEAGKGLAVDPWDGDVDAETHQQQQAQGGEHSIAQARVADQLADDFGGVGIAAPTDEHGQEEWGGLNAAKPPVE